MTETEMTEQEPTMTDAAYTVSFNLDDIPLFATYQEAATILRCSTKTVQRYVKAEQLQAFGERKGRKIVGQSLRNLIEQIVKGEPLCLANPNRSAASMEPAQPTRTKRANGSRRSRSATASATPGVSLTNKRGIRGERR